MKVYIIIKHDTIGGAEKRFTGLWTKLAAQPGADEFFLVLSQTLLNDLLLIDDLKEGLTKYRSHIILHSFSGGYFQNSLQSYKLIKKLGTKQSRFHFIEFFPFFFPPGAKLFFSITASDMGIYTLKGRLPQYFAGLLARKVDILDPWIHRSFSRLFWYKKKRILLTPCTYCNNDKFIIEEKNNWIVFLGIFTHIKQPLKYLKSIPAIYERIKPLNLPGVRFFVLGNGDMEAELLEEFKNDRYRTVPAEIKFSSNPEAVLNKSKVFISVQKFNNYPSKSLVEALSSGNIPVAADNGQTRWIAHETFSYYVKEDFTDAEIAEQVYKVLALPDAEFNNKSNLARNFVVENHNFNKMSHYYSRVFYEQKENS